jgi:hypothetical protein
MAKWEKGQSGNPAGRPKKIFNFISEVDAQLAQVDPNDEKGRTHGEIAAEKYVLLMKQGSIRATNEYLDRKLGKPPQAIGIADLRPGTRDDAIAGILESMKILQGMKDDEERVIN